jgi:hypothetical protein
MDMKDDSFLKHHLFAKLNVRAFSVLCALILICAGAYMCFKDLSATGTIDIKAAFMQGKIETGSLGIMAMFLGVLIVLALNLNKPYKGQEIRIVINGHEITGKGLSYRKMRELVAAATQKAPESKLEITQPVNSADPKSRAAD